MIETDIELENGPLDAIGYKIDVLCKFIGMHISKVVGYSNTHDVSLDFHGANKKLIAHLSGNYDESDDTMPVTLTIYGIEDKSFNFHPFGMLGGFDKETFIGQFTEDSEGYYVGFPKRKETV